MEVDSAFYERAVARVYRNTAFLAAAGSVAGIVFQGWLWALAFLAGAAASYLNFSWLHQLVSGLGPDAPPPRKRLFVFLLLRFLLLAAGGYVILKVFGMSVIAALSGLFVSLAAVILEGLYELVHGT